MRDLCLTKWLKDRLVSQYFCCPVPQVLDTLLHPHVARTRGTNCRKSGNLPSISVRLGIWDHWIEKHLRIVFLSILHVRVNFEAFHLPFAGYRYLSGRSCDRPSSLWFSPFSYVFKQDVRSKFLPRASHVTLMI
jgi:hypothetical protein